VHDERLEDALRAAQLYYFQDRTMEAIARELHTSRSTISRLLSYAREQGLIEFRLRNPLAATPELQQRLADRFGVNVHVVPVAGSPSDLEVLDNVAKYAARTLNAFFDSDMVLAVAWGTTTTAISRHLVPKPTRGSTVVQLNGAGNPQTTGIDYVSEIVRRFGANFDATVEEFPVPAFFDYADTKMALWRERSVRRILDLQARADTAIFGVGAPTGPVHSHVYSAGYVEERDLTRLTADGVVGDIATVFLRADGSWRDIGLNARCSGPPLDQLAAVPERICVVPGRHRLPGLRGALAAGLVTQLIIDEDAAAALLG
jgi:deoxyribonucleoside regulator